MALLDGINILPESFWNRILQRENTQKMKPKVLHISRKEYKDFDLSVFCKHIYQEIYGQYSTAYWQYKNAEKEEEKKKIRDALKPFLK